MNNVDINNVYCGVNCSVKYPGSNYIYKTQFKIYNSKLLNSKSINGGGLYVDSVGSCKAFTDKIRCRFNNTDFLNNTAQYSGGGLYIRETFYDIEYASFKNNIAIGDDSD